MPPYTLTWEVDIEAENPVAAAEEAWAIMQGSGSVSNCFHIKNEVTGSISYVDLFDRSNNDIQED
jgi:hypothetical protein